MKTCPKCKLISPPAAERCDCGWDFVSASQQLSYVEETRDWQVLPWYKRGFSFGWKLAIFGASFGWYFTIPKVSSSGGEVLGISEGEFIRFLMGLVCAVAAFAMGFIIGALRRVRKPRFG